MSKKVIVIGAGFSGLSAAAFMAKAGWQVTVLEKHATPGGRARQFTEQGFTFDRGPSWYWMPDIFDRYFAQFGKQREQFYTLQRLDPSYRVFWDDGLMDVPADISTLKKLFESIEPGSSIQLEKFLAEATYKYKTGMQQLAFKPGRSVTEFLNADVIRSVFKLDLFISIQQHIRKYFRHPKLQTLLEFPVLFLGALPSNTPALYSFMNYADIIGGTWYPQGGMYSIVKAMHELAMELGVTFHFNEDVQQLSIQNDCIKTVVTTNNTWTADAIIGSADYHFIERNLLPSTHRSYSEKYWNTRTMAPSCLLYYVGLNKKLNNLSHHSLFFDTSFERHANEIYTAPQWPSAPLFYANAPSVTDNDVAPQGNENLFLLVPVAAGLEGDDESLRGKYLTQIISRMEQHLQQPIQDAIIYKKTFAGTDFIRAYNSFKGNAYGLANTLRQTALLKPSCKSKKVKNLFYTGQLTVPGPGVPPALISGEIVAKEVIKYFG